MLTIKKSLAQMISVRMLMVYVLGFISGFPLAFTGSTLQAWLASYHIDIVAIGFVTLVGLPYGYKFLWAPVLDRFKPRLPLIKHRRKAWIVCFQVILTGILILLAQLNPKDYLVLIAIVSFLIAFVSASQDIVIDAYRTEYLLADERGIGSASFTFAYRLAMLVSGGLGLIIADYFGWKVFLLLSAAVTLLGAIVTMVLPSTAEQHDQTERFLLLLINPVKNFLAKPYAVTILFFIISYKFAEGYILSLATVFFLKHIQLSLAQVGVLFKTFGFASTIIGAYLGGVILPRMGLFNSLWYFGLLQALGILLYVYLAIVGHGYALTAVTITIEMAASGMATVALMAYLMSLCDTRYTGAQFAIFTALMVLGRLISGPLASVLVDHWGWAWMFFIGFLASIPGLVLLRRLQSVTI